MINKPLFREWDRVHCAYEMEGAGINDALDVLAVRHTATRWSSGMTVYTVNAFQRLTAPDITESKRILPYFVWREDWI